jgi:hypothetical protein
MNQKTNAPLIFGPECAGPSRIQSPEVRLAALSNDSLIPKHGVIAVLVVTSDSGQSVGNATVQVAPDSAGLYHSRIGRLSGSAGIALLPQLEAGDYWLRVAKVGFHMTFAKLHIRESMVDTVVIPMKVAKDCVQF